MVPMGAMIAPVAATLCERQGNFASEPLVAPIEPHFTPELTMFSTMRVPNPRCVGAVTVGPPNSNQRKLKAALES